MENQFIRVANEEDIQLINSYFKQALDHYERQGELLAMQDIKYLIENMNTFMFFLKEQNDEYIAYQFELPDVEPGTSEVGELIIPLPKGDRVN